MKTRKWLALLLSVIMVLTATLAAAESVYPLGGDVKLTYFGQLHKKVAKAYSGWEELEVVQDWFKATGVTLEFQCPPSGMEEEQFSMMLVSDKYPDIIAYSFHDLPGGLTKYYEDGVIIDLTPYLEEYAPNYTKWLNDNPSVKKEIMDDSGRILCFPFAKGGGYLLSTWGPIVREDILAELNLEMPTTIDEWETVLKAVKEAHPDMIPFTGDKDRLLQAFSPAYGCSWGGWFADDEGKARFAPADEAYKPFIEKMASWFEMGLIDQDIISMDEAAADNKMNAGLAFATYGAGSAQVAAYMNANAGNETYSVVGAPFPSLEKGQIVKFATQWPALANPEVTISTSCKNVEAAIRMYDWAFGEEGSTRLNWGIENVSYTVDETGAKHYTDLILHNPDGKSVDAILANYALVAVKGPCALVQDPDYMLDYYALDQQKRSMQNWATKDNNSFEFPHVSYIDNEASDFTNKMSDIETYTDTMIAKFIIGTEPLSGYDTYIDTVNKMGLSDAVQIQQNALNRFLSRGE